MSNQPAMVPDFNVVSPKRRAHPRLALHGMSFVLGSRRSLKSLTDLGQRRDATLVRFPSAILGDSAKRLVFFEQAVDEVGIVETGRAGPTSTHKTLPRQLKDNKSCESLGTEHPVPDVLADHPPGRYC